METNEMSESKTLQPDARLVLVSTKISTKEQIAKLETELAEANAKLAEHERQIASGELVPVDVGEAWLNHMGGERLQQFAAERAKVPGPESHADGK